MLNRRVLFILFILCSLSYLLPDSLKAQEEYAGTLQIVAIDEIDKVTGTLRCKYAYYLKAEDGILYRIEDTEGVLRKIKPSEKIKVSGDKIGNRIIVKTAKSLSVVPSESKHTKITAAAEETAETIGEQKTLVALFNFPDEPEQPITIDYVKDELINKTDSTNNYYKENSYEKTWLNADFIDWQALPHNSSDYASEKYDLTEDSIAALDSTVYFPDYERLIFIYDNTDSKSWGASGSVGKWSLNSEDGGFDASVEWIGEGSDLSGSISHELGHGFGFGHASSVASSYPYYVPESLLKLDPTSSSGTEYNDYGDDADTMGSSYPYYSHFSTVWKSQAQWIDSSQIKVADSPGGEYTLDQIEISSTGVKAIKIPIGKDVNGEDFYYWLEYRKNLGSFDMNGAEADKVQIRAKHHYNYGTWNGNAVRFKEQKNIFNATPTKVSELSGSISIAAGENHSLALKSDGTVWAWGDNDYGQLGNGTITANSTPVQVSTLNGIIAISAGGYHSLALKSDDTVWTWGANWDGQLGDGTNSNSNVPVQVSNINGIIAISGGYTHSIALKSDGTVWTFGRNDYGQLGDGSNTYRNIPVQLNGLSDVIAIAGDYHSSLALKSDGTVWAWGYNGYGQLGNGTTANSNVPVQVSNINGIIAISGGAYHSRALKSDGTVWTWGENLDGQLGDGTTTDSSIPVQTKGVSGITAIAGGGWNGLAIDSDNTVWAWGGNWNGQLGNGTTEGSSIPVQIKGVSGIIAIAGGGWHSLAIDSDDTVWEWGKYFLDSGNYYIDIDTDTSFYDPYRGVKVELIEKTGTDAESKAKLKISLSGINISPEDVLNFGTVPIHSTSTNTVTITNNSGEEIGIDELSISGKDSKLFKIATDGCSNKNLASGESCNVTISFSPDSEGDKFGILHMPNNDSLRPKATISLYGYAAQTPVVSTVAASDITAYSATLNATVNANGLSTTAWFEYGTTSGDYINTTSIQTVTGSNSTSISSTVSGLSPSTTYYYRIAAQNSEGTSYGDEMSFATLTDTTLPTGSISINGGAAYTKSAAVTLSLSATDNTGVTGYYLSTSPRDPISSDPGWTSVSSTTSYSESVSYTLSIGDGSKTVYVWYKDAAENVSDSASASITLDTTAPTVSITSPTSDATYSTTSSTINLGGSASDSTSGVSSVAWSNSATGSSGTANGTTSWSVSNINLSNGNNSITVTATDNAGNTSTDTLAVMYSVTTSPSPVPTTPETPMPTPTPMPQSGCPDSVTATTASASPDELEIAKGDTEDVVISVKDDNGCPAAGVKVKKKVSSASKKKIKISPTSATTDASGQVTFTIKAKKDNGKAVVKFSVKGVKNKPKVKVALTKSEKGSNLYH